MKFVLASGLTAPLAIDYEFELVRSRRKSHDYSPVALRVLNHRCCLRIPAVEGSRKKNLAGCRGAALKSCFCSPLLLMCFCHGAGPFFPVRIAVCCPSGSGKAMLRRTAGRRTVNVKQKKRVAVAGDTFRPPGPGHRGCMLTPTDTITPCAPHTGRACFVVEGCTSGWYGSQPRRRQRRGSPTSSAPAVSILIVSPR